MKLFVLLANVEINDQYGTSDGFLCGVFDRAELVPQGQKVVEGFILKRRVSFRTIEVETNNVYVGPKLKGEDP